MGKLFKSLVKVGVAAATVGGLCYVFRDKIKESKVYQEYDVDDKLAKVKSTIKEKMPKSNNEKDYVDDDEIFFDDLDAGSAERDYVSIDSSSSDNTSEDKSDAEQSKEDKLSAKAEDVSSDTAADEAEESVPTIEI